MKNLFVLLYLLTLISGCSMLSTPIPNQKLEPSVLYKRDMIVNGQEGVLVMPQADSYDFHVEARGNLDLFVMTTCSREYSKEAAWNVQQTIRTGPFGWGSKKIDKPREVQFTYKPTDLEKDGNCKMELGGYEVNGGRHSWSLIEFEHDKFQQSATLMCNGVQDLYHGVSACQAKEGLYQRITFPDEVIASEKSDCGISGKGTSFDFKIKKDLCTTLFKNTNDGKLHKLTTFGYENILIRQ